VLRFESLGRPIAGTDLLSGKVSSDIHGSHDVGYASVEEHSTSRDLHVDQAAVLLFVFAALHCRVKDYFVQYVP
jgi:hypothetical protein